MELCIALQDKPGGGISSYKRGEVLVACADGWAWSEAEFDNPLWVIIRTPLTDVEVEALNAPYRAVNYDIVVEPFPSRKFRLDVTTLGLGVSSVVVDVDVAAVRAAVVTVP